MQTSLARRQRHRRGIRRGRPRGSSNLRRVLIAIPILLLTVFVLVGAAGMVAAAAAYNYYSQGLPDPKDTLSNLSFDQQTTIVDRTGKIVLAKLGEFKRELVTFDELPPELLDATTAIEDKDFWSNPGFDFAGFVSATIDTLEGRPRGGSTITQQLVRARLLPASAFEGSREERKMREIIQSLRLTQAYPGEDGKKEIITAYLNQNFYGNQSYGVKAAARTLLQQEPQGPHPRPGGGPRGDPPVADLVRPGPQRRGGLRDAEQEPGRLRCRSKISLVVPDTTEIYKRRNYVLDLMKSRSPLSGALHTPDEYEAAKSEPIVLAPQLGNRWRAPQFVLQVRQELGTILCPDVSTDQCDKIDTGGYQVTTTLDTKMQATVEKWLYAAAWAPNHSNTRTDPEEPEDPVEGLGLARRASAARTSTTRASAVMDYRTGQVLAYAGSASFNARATRKFQPQFDVLSDGWRQPGSSIKPINYAIGIEDETMTAATLFMDVTTNFGGNFIPTQADKAERGPVRLREALQFSLNIPSIKAGLMNGLKHFYQRSKDFGVHYVPGSTPVTSMSIGTLEVHPIDMIGAYGAIADGGKLMPRTTILKVVDSNGTTVWPEPARQAGQGPKTVDQPPDRLHHDRHPEGQHRGQDEPVLGRVGGHRRLAPPAGRIQDGDDERQPRRPRLRLRRAAGRPEGAGDRRRRLDGQQRQLAGHRHPVARIVRAALVADHRRGDARARRSSTSAGRRASTTATRRRVHGLQARAVHDEEGHRALHPRHRADARRTTSTGRSTSTRRAASSGRTAASGRRRRSARSTSARRGEPPELAAGRQQLDRSGPPAAPGGGGGAKGTHTSYFYGTGFFPFGRSWGGIFAPSGLCPLAPPPTPPPCDNIFGLFCPPPDGGPEPPAPDPAGPGKTPKP